MMSVALKWGIISGLILIGVPIVFYLFAGGGPDTYRVGELIGYATIVLSLLMIFIAINEARKMQADQRISFGKGLLIGLAISAMGGTLFGIYNWAYVTYLEPDFLDQYYNYYIEQLRNSGEPAAQIEQQIQRFESEKALFGSPWVQFATMFFTVFVIGLIVSLFSAGIQTKVLSKSKRVDHAGAK